MFSWMKGTYSATKVNAFERMNIACPTEVMMDGLKRIVKAWRTQEKDA